MNIQREALRLVGSSPAILALNKEIETAAASDAKVLITGETGVGKEVVARLIHKRSSRCSAPMAAINCAGIPDALLESELFGHVRGSFTDAYRDKPGLFETANKGTAFLDEAGEMSLRMQAMLLRFLENGELQRVGADHSTRRVNVRIIAATNRDLCRRIEAGEFRADLYYRLNVILLEVPPLRSRKEDVPELLEYFLDSCSAAQRAARPRLTPEALERLVEYRWPGNVRELKNVAERLVARSAGEVVVVRDLPEECRSTSPMVAIGQPSAAGPSPADIGGDLVQRMVQSGESFWSVVYQPFIDRDLPREHLRAVVKIGLAQTAGNYRMVLQLFNLPPTDYKRFLAFLRKHQCHFPVQAFRVPPRTLRQVDGGAGKMLLDGYSLEAAAQQPGLGRGPGQARPGFFHPPRTAAGAGVPVDRMLGQSRAS